VIAASAGLAIAQLAIQFLVKWPPADIPRLADASLHVESFAFAAGVALLAAVGCSILPGWFLTRDESGRRTPERRHSNIGLQKRQQNAKRVRVCASSHHGHAAGYGRVVAYQLPLDDDRRHRFRNHDALSMNLVLRGAADSKARRAFYSRLLEKLRQSPGVTSAAAILLRPFEGTIGWDAHYQFEFEGKAAENREPPQANFEVIAPGYFQTVGTRCWRGAILASTIPATRKVSRSSASPSPSESVMPVEIPSDTACGWDAAPAEAG